jgi:hypothetical protein
MNAVWSFWSKPYLEAWKSIWCSEKQHLLSWILSLQQARKFFGRTVLFTDDYGARMLVDGLQLEFDVVSTSLNSLNGHDPKWWALGKIYTYSSQHEPFIHIDNDVFYGNRCQSIQALRFSPRILNILTLAPHFICPNKIGVANRKTWRLVVQGMDLVPVKWIPAEG